MMTEGGGSDGIGSVVTPDPPAAIKPDLFVKEIAFDGGKTKYYNDENVKLIAKVKNAGASVNTSITQIKLEYIRCQGDKCNGDEKVVGSGDNIKGVNLPSGATKAEDITFGAPSTENKYIYYACIDTQNTVNESNEVNNCSGQIWMRVHKRPDFVIERLSMDNGQTNYNLHDIAHVQAVTKNNGGEPFIDIRVGYYLDNALVEDDNMRHWNLNEGDTKGEDMYLVMPNTPGTHTLTACADYNRAVQETDETNNCASVVFEVMQPLKPPIITKQTVGNIKPTSAQLNADFHTNGLDVTYYFQYGETTGYGLTTAVWNAGPSAGGVSTLISGLSPETVYHYRFVISNSDGTSYGVDMTFTTSANLPTLPGDLNRDGKVDIFDFNIMVPNWGSTNCGNIADIDGDCVVDIFDFNIFVSNFGKTY
jgi:hypothetical protein